MSFLMSPSHLLSGLPCGRIDIGFHLYTFYTTLYSGIRCKWPNQLIRCNFMWFIIFLCLISSSNSSFVLILHVPSLSFVGPKFFLNTFLSNTINMFFTVTFKTHTSQPYVTIGPIILQYSFNFDFFETSLLLKRNWELFFHPTYISAWCLIKHESLIPHMSMTSYFGFSLYIFNVVLPQHP